MNASFLKRSEIAVRFLINVVKMLYASFSKSSDWNIDIRIAIINIDWHSIRKFCQCVLDTLTTCCWETEKITDCNSNYEIMNASFLKRSEIAVRFLINVVKMFYASFSKSSASSDWNVDIRIGIINIDWHSIRKFCQCVLNTLTTCCWETEIITDCNSTSKLWMLRS